MRLIDADRVDFSKVFIGSSDFAKDTRAAAYGVINNQPTAFDVNKIVEQIEDMMKPGKCRHKFCETITEEKCTAYPECADCISDRIVELIKSAMGQPDTAKNNSDFVRREDVMATVEHVCEQYNMYFDKDTDGKRSGSFGVDMPRAIMGIPAVVLEEKEA